jgi:PAS domain S-box-containing protein
MKGETIEHLNEKSYSCYLDSDKPVFITDRKGELISVNDAFCEILGVSRREITGLPFVDTGLLTKDAREQSMQRHVSKLIGKETPFYTMDVITKDGDILSLEIDTKSVIKNGKIAGEINIVQKITDQLYDKKKTHETRIEKMVEPRYKLGDIDSLNSLEKVKEKTYGFNQNQTDINDLEDLYSDIDSHEEEIHLLNKKWIESQSELEDKNYAFRRLQNEFKKQKRRTELRDQEFDQLVKELFKSQVGLENKNDEIEQLKQIIEQRREGMEPWHEKKSGREDEEIIRVQLDLKDGVLKTRDEEVEKTKIQTDLEKKREELDVARSDFETESIEMVSLQKQVEDINKEAKKREQTLNWFNTELEGIKKQLSDSQAALKEKNMVIEDLQTGLEYKQKVLDAVNADLEIRNQIIDEIEKQLEEQQITLLDGNKTSVKDGMPDPYEQEYHNLKKQFSQLDEENRELKTAVEKLLEKIDL